MNRSTLKSDIEFHSGTFPLTNRKRYQKLMKTAWRIFKGFLLVWGFVTFVGFLIIAGAFLYQTGSGNRPTSKTADKTDVRFVLNWCGLGDERIQEVVHSYTSARSFTGDHLDAHAIRISHVDPNELVYDEGRGGGGWYRGDALTGTAKQAVDFAESWLNSPGIPWFPAIDEIRSSKMFVYIWSVDMAGTRPNAAQIIFVRPEDKMVFYFGAKL
jgi:hypothetical protein